MRETAASADASERDAASTAMSDEATAKEDGAEAAAAKDAPSAASGEGAATAEGAASEVGAAETPSPPAVTESDAGAIEITAPMGAEVAPSPARTEIGGGAIEITAPMAVGEGAGLVDTKIPLIEAPKRSWGKVVRRGLLALLVLLGIGVAAAKDPVLRWLVAREASRFGVELRYERVSLGFHRVDLHGVDLSLLGVRGMRVSIATVSAQVEGLAVAAVEAAGMTIALEGSAADRLLELGAWSNDHARLFELPGASSEVRITWVSAPGEAAWMDLRNGTLSSSGKGAVFRSPSASLLGVPVGALGATWTADGGTLAIGLGGETLEASPIRLDLHPTSSPPTGDLRVGPIKLEALGAPLGLSLPAPGAVLEGKASLTMGGARAGSEEIEGSLSMTLDGWVPPHPRELDGIVYGKRTSFETKLRVSADRRKVTLGDTRVAAGSFKLKGGGSLDRQGDHAKALLDLKGQLACSEVARSAAIGNLGSFLGKIVGDVAQTTVGGSVAISVRLEADTRNLAGATIKQEVGVGCGLRLPKLF
jgi:hypothetical protein